MKNKMSASEQLLTEIGEIQRDIEQVDTNAQKVIKRIKNKAEKETRRMKRMIRRRMLKLFVIFIARPDRTKKTLKFVNGKIGSFLTPPVVRISSIKNVLKNLKLKNLSKFIRTVITEEIDKEAILMDPTEVKDIKGISVTQKERFEVVPAETKEPVLEDIKKLQKEIPSEE